MNTRIPTRCKTVFLTPFPVKGKILFTVGDVKQSIYRFRLAQPEIFLEKYESYRHASAALPGQARKILLTCNFRSRPEVLEATNFIFRNILSREMGEMEYGEAEKLNAGATYYAPRAGAERRSCIW